MQIFSQLFRCFSSKEQCGTKRGFTLIEMLVVMSIMLIITAALLVKQSRFDSSTILRSLAYGVALSVRQAQVYGTSVVGTSTSQVACGSGYYNLASGNCYASGYGIYFSNALSTASPSSYILFADLNGDGKYEANEFVKSFMFSNGYTISNFCAVNQSTIARCEPSSISSLAIVFKRPNPDAQFVALDVNDLPITGPPPDVYSQAYIQIAATGDPTNTKRVTITVPGEVSVCTTVAC
jgi:prepilin-type N-terminal cleavage/methylation domain-containing protein